MKHAREVRERRGLLAIPSVLGIAAGIVTSLVISWISSHPSKPTILAPTAASAGTQRPIPARPDAFSQAKIQELERRVRELERADAGAQTVEAGPPREGVKDRAQAYQEAVVEHWSEATDSRWAPVASASLIKDLEGLGKENHFSVVQVDCRSLSCVGVVEWPSYAEATSTYLELVQSQYALNCQRTVAAEPPQDPSAPYRTTVLLDCKDPSSGRRADTSGPDP